MSFNAKLASLLKSDRRFVDEDGELLIAAVQDQSWKTDHKLIGLLLSDKEIRDKFFEEISGHWVFCVSKFIDFIAQ